jgi:hypothetical protein
VKSALARASFDGLMVIRTVILWVHVLSGVVWVGTCATFILASVASESDEASAFAIKVTPRINRLCLPLAIAIPLTGIGNLFFTLLVRGSLLPGEFIGILAAKVVLLAVMASALFVAWRTVQKLEQNPPVRASSGHEIYVRSIVACYALIVMAGIAALALGLWLSGT